MGRILKKRASVSDLEPDGELQDLLHSVGKKKEYLLRPEKAARPNGGGE